VWCKARAEKQAHFTPPQHHDEVPLKAREASVYQPWKRTEGFAEGEDSPGKSVKREKQPLIGFE
jgi:hypothetical protein